MGRLIGDDLLFSSTVFKSLTHRDRVNVKVMNTRRIKSMCYPKDMAYTASTTARRIVPLPQLMLRVAAPSVTIWKNSGRRIIWHETARRTLKLSIST
jgi:hypothetical protein